ncbi:uncharacterized protein OCT59_027394 [Rhizophagus irregularis]|uniref:uncharacterized protein n=1 Tax=Rhizophagus irregularis TaxID=588596 RepID=UPI00332B33B6|nr:hypothetical protein OCT59_027394 [Rhizophagus irregularis]
MILYMICLDDWHKLRHELQLNPLSQTHTVGQERTPPFAFLCGAATTGTYEIIKTIFIGYEVVLKWSELEIAKAFPLHCWSSTQANQETEVLNSQYPVRPTAFSEEEK